MQARDYQIECTRAVLSALARNRKALCHLATGLGKTVVMGLVAQQIHKPILIVAHLTILIQQTVDLLRRMLPDRHISIEQGQNRWEHNLFSTNEIVVACSASLANRLHKYEPGHFGLIMVDEAHHAVQSRQNYGRIHKHLQQTPWFGVTATPIRADHESLKPIFGECVYTYDTRTAIEQGWLVPVQRYPVEIQNIQCTTAGTHDANDEDHLSDHGIHQVTRPLIDICNRNGRRRLGLVFTSTVDQAERMAYAVNVLQPGRAACISGTTPIKERQLILQHYKLGGQVQYLFGCDCFIEGFDNTEIAVVVPKACQHWARYCQMVGRALRPAANVLNNSMSREERLLAIRNSRKPSSVILDIYGVGSKHSLIQPEDTHDEVVKTYPVFKDKTITEEPKIREFDPELYPLYQILENERAARDQMKRLRQVTVDVRYTVTHADAFECGTDEMTSPPRRRKRITPQQITQIKRLHRLLQVNKKIESTMLAADAAEYIEQLKEARDQGKPSCSMIAFLEKRNWNCDGLTWAEAAKLIKEFLLLEE